MASESSVSSALLKKLRENQDLEVFKHADVGMKGLPDSSATGYGRTLWMEFKLHQPAKHGEWTTPEKELAYFQKEAPTQAETCKRLAAKGRCVYIIWRKKRRDIYVMSPAGEVLFKVDQFKGLDLVALWLVQELQGLHDQVISI